MRAVFLDRDGVINENRRDHVKSWAEFRFLPGSLEAVARLTEADVRVFVITNQAIVNRGLVSQAVVEEINQRMLGEIERRGGRVTAIAYCPHRPDERCRCRKPEPGLLTSLAQEHGVDLQQSVLIGDAVTDIQAGEAVGCQTVLVLTGRGRNQLPLVAESTRNNVTIAADLDDAVNLLLRRPSANA